jgi:hypothetical protein
MKFRQGFVSNSSSTSFCIIGTDDTSIIQQLALAEGKDFECDKNLNFHYGVNSGKYINFFGDDRPYYAGADAKPILETMTLIEARKYFVKYVKEKLHRTISVDNVDLFFGESGTG